MKIPAVLLAVVLAGPAFAATTAPRPVTVKAPAYPAELSDTGTKGRAVIAVTVKPDGSTGALEVESTDHASFAAAALAVLPEWKFAPATKDGAAVETTVVVPFEFVPPLPQQVNAYFKRKVFLPMSDLVLTPKEYGSKLRARKKIDAVYPRTLAGSRVEEEVTVRFIIGPDGSTHNPEFVTRPRKELVFPALAAIAQAQFVPPVKDGRPVFVEHSVTLKFAPPQPRREITVSAGGGYGGGGDDGPD